MEKNTIILGEVRLKSGVMDVYPTVQSAQH